MRLFLVPPCRARSLWSEFGTFVSPVISRFSLCNLTLEHRCTICASLLFPFPRDLIGAILEPSCHLLVLNLCIQTPELCCTMKLPLLFTALRTERIWTLRVTSEIVRQPLLPDTGAPLRDTRITAYWIFPFSPITAELASAGIECRAPQRLCQKFIHVSMSSGCPGEEW